MDADVVAYYDQGNEDPRLRTGLGRVELVRTQELLRRHLPPPPARVLDVGGATGVHAEWLLADGYDVHLLDPVSSQVEVARTAGITADVGDARALPFDDASADACLLLGPLYHLPDDADRRRALAEACRVTKPGGLVAVAGISRYAPLLDGLAKHVDDAGFFDRLGETLVTGRHANPGRAPGQFTTAYFHEAHDLHAELAACLDDVEVYGVEGPAIFFPHLEALWERDPERILEQARRVELQAPFLSGHLLGVGRTA